MSARKLLGTLAAVTLAGAAVALPVRAVSADTSVGDASDAAAIHTAAAPLALGGALSPACLGFVAVITNPLGPFGPFGIILSGGPVAYVGAVQGAVFGNPAGPGLLQVCA